MQQDPIVFTVFLVFTGAAIFATAALFARQSLLVAYILLGALLGPSALGLVSDPELIRSISEFGIMFLLFLLGLNLQPQELIRMVRKTTLVTLFSSLLFFAVGCTVSLAFGFSAMEALLVGGAATFSSTIIGLKLLPTTALHHQRMGEIIIAVLLLQDLIAIAVLLLLEGLGEGLVLLLAAQDLETLHEGKAGVDHHRELPGEDRQILGGHAAAELRQRDLSPLLLDRRDQDLVAAQQCHDRFLVVGHALTRFCLPSHRVHSRQRHGRDRIMSLVQVP